MLLGWKNQCCKNGHTVQNNLRVQCNPYQITHDIFHRTGTNNPNIYMEQQKTQNRQSNSEEQKVSRRHLSPRLQAILQSYSHQDSVVLVPKQTYRPMEQNREPRNKPWHLWSINLWQGRQEHKIGKRKVYSASIAGKPGQLHAKQWNWNTPSHHAQNKLKMA